MSVAVDTAVAVSVGVWVSVAFDVAVAVSVGVRVSVAFDVAVAVSVGVWVSVAVDVAVAVSVAVWVSVAVEVAVAVPVGAAHCREIALASSVTAPVCANALPFKLAPVFSVMDVSARMLPMNWVFVSNVAELPALHHTLQGSPPVTVALGDVINVDADLNIHTPEPLNTRFPLRAKAVAQYVPGTSGDTRVRSCVPA